jgi:hypothetical protein
MLHLPSLPPPQGQEDPLARAADRLREMLAAEIPGHERRWAQCVERALVLVEAAMRQHLAALQEPDGFLAEVDVTRPTLARQADQLLSGDEDLIAQLIALRDQARRAAQAFQPTLRSAAASAGQGIADLSAIRARGEQLLDSVEKHVAAETKLVQESVLTEIGVGD